MKQFYYIFRSLVRGRGSNVIKIISLALGLMVGIILFARVAFEMSYNGHYRDADNLYEINCTYYVNGENKGTAPVVYAPMPGLLQEHFPDKITGATATTGQHLRIVYNGSHRMENIRTIFADEHFLSTMGVDIIRGKEEDLTNPDVLFISESLARNLYGDTDPNGQVLLIDKNAPMTVRGVFRDIPENSELRPQVIASFITMKTRYGRPAGLNGDGSYRGYLRFRGREAAREVETRLPAFTADVLGNDTESGYYEEYIFKTVNEQYRTYPVVRQMIRVMSILAFAILFITVMNYILITLSSLADRTKSVGVYKCSGASPGNIFGMFLCETAVIITVSLLLIVFLMLNFREPLEDLTAAPLRALFRPETLWVPITIIVAIFLIAGVIPGRVFSAISVTHVFRRYSERRNSWKRPLLFIQFAGITFIIGLLTIVMLQYQRLTGRDMGYEPQAVYYTHLRGIEDGLSAENLKGELRRMPEVESVGIARSGVNSSPSGEIITDNTGRPILSIRIDEYDYDYVPTMKIRIRKGRNIEAEGEILVNEELVRRMNWEDEIIGKQLYRYDESYGPVVGVMEDFPVQSVYEAQEPLVVIGEKQLARNILFVRLGQETPEAVARLNKKLEELYPTQDMRFGSMVQRNIDEYQSIRRFRDAVLLASFSVIFITLMGLFGYINDEIRRRSKEIAIRKVNGAQAGNILELISRDLTWTALPAILLGIAAAYLFGGKWLDQFAERVTPHIALFLLIGLCVWGLIMGIAVLKSWRVANDNPVNSIKSE